MKIAVIGAGISGLVTSYLLSRSHEITVYEANAEIGGHTHTEDVAAAEGSIAVDTGFIVFNAKTYPNFIKLLKQLGVDWQPSEMSFSVQCEQTGLVFSPSTPNALFAQRPNMIRPSFYRMLWDAVRFRKASAAILNQPNDGMTLATYLKKEGYGQRFIHHFIIPMGAAIWSADPERFMDFPVRYLVTFFQNHGFLNLKDQPQWRTVKGGSKQYLPALIRSFKEKIRVSSPVQSIRRHPDRVELTLAQGHMRAFDQVVIATHSDQALNMLTDSSDAENEVLGAIPYQENLTVLHTDANLMPSHRTAWASWNYRIPKKETGRVALTYDMNRLQNLSTTEQFCVTLNMPGAIDPAKHIKEFIYHHPIYDPKGLAARKRHHEINGTNRTWYCGAYWGYGFHEDGVKSALAVCENFGEEL